ncbi:MAG: hypothetical protein JJV98_02850 [Desulfosarcina sp.]|nr:hypothetical protein [Desulfobacterales bacterium]
MTNIKFDIVFEGRFVEGADPDRVKALIGQIFKVGRGDLERFFGGRRIVIKKRVDLADARRFEALMRKAGAVCRRVPQGVPPTAITASQSTLVYRKPCQKPAPEAQAAPVTASAASASGSPAGLGERLKSIKTEEFRDRVRTGLSILGSNIREDFKGGGLRRRFRSRKLQAAVVALAIAVVIIAAAVWHEGERMPADAKTLETFVARFNTRLLDIRDGRSRAVTYVKIARATIEDMGYDYDKTLLYWRFDRELSEDPRRRSIHDDYLIGPLKVLFELDAVRMEAIMAPETYARLENTMGIGENISLQSIRMLKECARGEALVKHEALVKVLQKYGMAVDSDFPEISVKEAFYGLSQNGLIRIHKRREWKDKRVDLEILDREQIAVQEKKLLQLESMYAQYAQQP